MLNHQLEVQNEERARLLIIRELIKIKKFSEYKLKTYSLRVLQRLYKKNIK